MTDDPLAVPSMWACPRLVALHFSSFTLPGDLLFVWPASCADASPAEDLLLPGYTTPINAILYMMSHLVADLVQLFHTHRNTLKSVAVYSP
jgi:hypothetical protein